MSRQEPELPADFKAVLSARTKAGEADGGLQNRIPNPGLQNLAFLFHPHAPQSLELKHHTGGIKGRHEQCHIRCESQGVDGHLSICCVRGAAPVATDRGAGGRIQHNMHHAFQITTCSKARLSVTWDRIPRPTSKLQ